MGGAGGQDLSPAQVPGGLRGRPALGESFWLEGGAVWPVSLLGFRERKQDCPTIPRRGRSRGGWVGTWHSGSGDPGACGGLGTLTRSKLLVTRRQGALRMGRMQRAGTQFLGSIPGPLQLCQSARPVGPPLPLGEQEPLEPPPPRPYTRYRQTPPRQRPTPRKCKCRPTVSRWWAVGSERAWDIAPHPAPPTQMSAPPEHLFPV